MTQYRPANTDWLAQCRYGIGVHWTAQTLPLHGETLPFQRAVERFDLDSFVEAVLQSKADYLIFTATHALQMLPAPHPIIDAILPGRTAERDLIGEIADGLAAENKHLILYYNHSCNQQDDPEWERAVGYHDTSKERFASNLCDVVAHMGERYGERVRAWWFDSSYSVDPRGPHNSVTTDLHGFQFPWERFTEAAKAGFPQRLVTYNAGVNQTFLYTTHQDYWAGEMVDLDHPPARRYAGNGLQWHAWTCLDDRRWVHTRKDTGPPEPLYSDDKLQEFVRACCRHCAPVCFNVIVYQEGTLSPKAVGTLARLGDGLGM